MNLPRLSVDRPVSITMLMICLTLLGIGSWSVMSIDLFPNIDFPMAFIQTPYPGVDPAEMENIVTRKIEEEINTVENVKNITSFSFEGFSHIMVEFTWGTDLDLASIDLREKVDIAKRKLPRDIEQVTVAKLDINAPPVLEISLGGMFPLKELRQLADNEIKPAFERIEGVANVEVFGGLEREIRIKVLPDRMRAMQMTIDDVITAVTQDNKNTPAGDLTEGLFKYLVRVEGEFATPQDLGNIIIKQLSGRPVYLREVAIIEDGHKEIESIARLNHLPAVTLKVRKEPGANPVAISDAAHKIIPHLEERFDGQLRLTIGNDRSTFIRDSINMVEENATMGALYAIIVLFIFLKNYRATFIIGLSIPLAVVMTFALMYLKPDMTLNLMTLGGLALGIGMMVDSSIVVLENIYRFIDVYPERSRKENVIAATEEVMLPIMASTLTTVAVFLPIGFVPGMVGEIFLHMSLAIVFSLVASLLVSITLVPMLSSKILRLDSAFLEDVIFSGYVRAGNWVLHHRIATTLLVLLIGGSSIQLATSSLPAQLWHKWSHLSGGILDTPPTAFLVGIAVSPLLLVILPFVGGILLWLFNRAAWKGLLPMFDAIVFGIVRRVYVLALSWLLGRWWRQLLYAIMIAGLFVVSFSFQPPMEFFPAMDQGVFVVGFEMPEGTSVETVDLATKRIESLISEISEVDKIITNTQLGRSRVTVMLVPSDQRVRNAKTIIASLRPSIALIPGLRNITFTEPRMGPEGGKPIQIEVSGDEFPIIESLCRQVADRIKTVPGLKDLDDGVKEGRPEIKIAFDRERIRDLGVSISTISQMIRSFIFGTLSGTFKEKNEEHDIRVEVADSYKDEISKLEQLPLPLEDDRFVTLSQVARVVPGRGYSQIDRLNLERILKVQADLEGRPLGAVMADVAERLKGLTPPPGYAINFGGEHEEMMEAFGNLGIALVTSILLVYMIMAGQFESLIFPFIIMFTIPFSYIGVVLALNIAGFAFSITAMIGLIMLAGLVVNNGIILIEFINQRKADLGEDNVTAAVASGEIRFRPILMTVLTTVLGMLPLALGIGAGSDFYQPLAITVMGGLIVSTLLTLTVIPVLYVICDNIITTARAWFDHLF